MPPPTKFDTSPPHPARVGDYGGPRGLINNGINWNVEPTFVFKVCKHHRRILHCLAAKHNAADRHMTDGWYTDIGIKMNLDNTAVQLKCIKIPLLLLLLLHDWYFNCISKTHYEWQYCFHLIVVRFNICIEHSPWYCPKSSVKRCCICPDIIHQLLLQKYQRLIIQRERMESCRHEN